MTESIRVALYNLDIPLEERKDNVIVFNSIKYASAKTGMPYKILKRVISNKSRVYIERLNGNYCIRHIK
jgi:hypothetical protein